MDPAARRRQLPWRGSMIGMGTSRAALLIIAVLLGGCADQAADPAPQPPAGSAGAGASEPGPSARAAASRQAADPSAGTAPSARAVQPPPANAVFDYQIGGAYPPAADVTMVDRDRSAAPAEGLYNVCYLNAFQTQPSENGWWQEHHDALLLRDRSGGFVEDPDWPGERLLDISTPAHRAELATIVGGWLAGCAAHGYRAVEPDNLDSYSRSRGSLSSGDAVAYAKLLVASAHSDGLAIGQKNTPQLARSGLGFDFAIAEECAVYDECGTYLDAYGGRVYEIEYTDNGTEAYHRACADHGARISIVLRDRGVAPAGGAGYHNENC
jgi:hypothetical protein